MKQPDNIPTWDGLPEPVRPAFLALWEQNQALSNEVRQLRAEVQALKSSSISWRWFSQPLVVLLISLGVMLGFAAYVVFDNGLGISPDRHAWFLYYLVPIAGPFVAFLLDRAARLRELRWFQWGIDLLVIAVALLRAISPLPGISGHALFLAYALLTTRSRAAQVLSVIVLAEVAYLKIFAWHDPTFFGGVLAAALAAALFHLPRNIKQYVTRNSSTS